MGDRDNMKCEECGEAYHFCGSCCDSLTHDDYRFCSNKCERMHEQGEAIKETITRLLDTLGEQGREDLANILYTNRVTESHMYGPQIEGNNPFDEDILREVLEHVFRGREFVAGWGLW